MKDFSNIKRIMFVCHGNICRSPMAEFIMKKLLSDVGLSEGYVIESSATSTEEIYRGVGNSLYPPAKSELICHGVPCCDRRATLLRREDYSKYDVFVGMDSQNVRNMHRIFGIDPEDKVCKLLDFTRRGGDVSDPYYSRCFNVAYNDILEGCEALFLKLTEKN